MFKFNRKSAVVSAVTGALLAVGTGAVAFVLATPPAQNANTPSLPNQTAVNQNLVTTVTTDAVSLVPGDATSVLTVSVKVTNNNHAKVQVGTPSVAIANCAATVVPAAPADFSQTVSPTAVGDVVAGGNVTVTSKWILLDTVANQTACLGATPQISVTWS
jgi:hypothetical protein